MRMTIAAAFLALFASAAHAQYYNAYPLPQPSVPQLNSPPGDMMQFTRQYFGAQPAQPLPQPMMLQRLPTGTVGIGSGF